MTTGLSDEGRHLEAMPGRDVLFTGPVEADDT